MIWFLLLMLLGPVPAAPQARVKRKTPAPKAAPVAFPIDSLLVEGSHNYTREQILAVAGLKVGQPADKKVFEEARNRLVASGAFESVGFRYAPSPDGRGYAVTFEVAEIQQVYPIQFENLPAPDAELRAWLKNRDPLFADKVPGTKGLMDRYARAIEEFLAQKSKPEKVLAKLTADKPEELFILFYPEGVPPVVADVRFTNNQVIPSEVLRNAIQSVAIGTEYRDARFRQLLDSTVRPLYEARGRVRVAFSEIATEPSKKVKGLLVTVQVNEGQSYNFGRVRMEGTQSMNEELAGIAKLHEGDLANFNEVQAALQRINTRMRRDGYMLVHSRTERQINDAKKTVDLTLQVDPGPQFLFGKLEIQGLDLHGEAEIKRLWALEEGKPFNADYPNYFLERVREEGIFDNLHKTSSVVRTNEKEHTVDVTLVFH